MTTLEEDEFLEGNDPDVITYDKIIVKKNNKNQVVLTDVKANWSLQRFIEELKDKDPTFAFAVSIQLVFNGKVMDDLNKKLYVYGFKNSTVVAVIFKVIGGAAYSDEGVANTGPKTTAKNTESEEDGQGRRYPKDVTRWPKKIQPSKEACSILTGDDCPKDQYNAILPCCKVSVSADGSFGQLKTQLYSIGSGLKCFNCEKPISYTYYSWLAQLTPEENQEYLFKFNEKALITPSPELHLCPNDECGAYVQRPLSMPDVRVRCTQCQAYDWCWVCSGKWISSGNTKCGNADCDPRVYYRALLINAKTATISYIENVPTLRLCPGCESALVEWTTECKHVICKVCGHGFCVCCLKRWEGNEHLGDITPKTCPIYQY